MSVCPHTVAGDPALPVPSAASEVPTTDVSLKRRSPSRKTGAPHLILHPSSPSARDLKKSVYSAFTEKIKVTETSGKPKSRGILQST